MPFRREGHGEGLFREGNMNRTSNRKTSQAIAFGLGILLLGILIQAASWIKGDTLVFPGVLSILRAFFRLLGQEKTWQQMSVTLGQLILTLVISTAAGTGIGLAQGLSSFAYRLFQPIMAFLRAIPMIVLTVIIMVLTVYARVPVAASSLILIPMIAEAVCEGCRRIEPELIDVWRMNSGMNLRIMGSVYLPLIGGYLKQAWFNAAGMGLRMVVTTEYLVQTRNSLGKAIFTSGYFFEYDEIYAYALIMILLALAISEIPRILGRAVQKRKKRI